MANDLTKKYFDKLWPIDLYKLSSFICSAILWPAIYYYEDNFFSHAHFITAFLLGNGYFYFATNNLTQLIKSTGQLPWYFVFQIVSIIGISYAHQINDFIYMAFIPILMAMYYFTVVQETSESFKQKKSIFAYTTIFCGLLIFESFKKGDIFSYGEMVALIGFGVWSFCTAYWGFELYFRDKKKLISRLFSSRNNNQNQTSRFDRMFFHDVINHTHALLLYLRSKKSDDYISKDDVQNVINEVKLLQDNLQHHFGFLHKDLGKKHMQVPFQLAMARVYNLIDAYFPKPEQVQVILEGHLGSNQSFENIRKCTVEMVYFHRIMTNILKNAYEAGSDKVECLFDYRDDGLYVKITNNMNKLKREKMNLEKDLGQVILAYNDKSSDHIGLESINQICQEIGGKFEFSINNSHWVSEFYLPSEVQRDELSDSIERAYKRAS